MLFGRVCVWSVGLVLAVSLLAGCGRETAVAHPTADEATARNLVELLRHGQFEPIIKIIDPDAHEIDPENTLAGMASYFPEQQPISVKVVDAWVQYGSDYSIAGLTMEYQFPDQWLLVRIQLKKLSKSSFQIREFSVSPLPEPLEETNRFTFNDKGPAQYLMLVTCCLAVLLSLYAFVSCLKSQIGWTKWIWLTATLAGTCQCSINWTTGAGAFRLLSVQIPVVTAGAGEYGPWILNVSVPLGAILFLALQDRLRETASDAILENIKQDELSQHVSE